jgi:hypothetical protein
MSELTLPLDGVNTRLATPCLRRRIQLTAVIFDVNTAYYHAKGDESATRYTNEPGADALEHRFAEGYSLIAVQLHAAENELEAGGCTGCEGPGRCGQTVTIGSEVFTCR